MTDPPLRIVHVTFPPPGRGRSPEELLGSIPHYTGLLAAQTAEGIDVAHVQSAAVDRALDRPEATYRFVSGRGASKRFLAAVRSFDPHVLHLHGVGFPAELRRLRSAIPGVPILAQDHANRPPRWWERRAFVRAFAAVDGFAFTAAEQAAPFRRLRGWPVHAPVFEIVEASTDFVPGDRDAARRALGLSGSPGVAWVGRLDDNKDPFTVVRGLDRAGREWPELRLWLCFADAPGRARLERVVAGLPGLRGRIDWIGARSHDEVELLLRAADVYVSGSHRESCGYALLEALACGTPPVVSDIPPFRAITGHGAVGAVFAPGDPADSARAFRTVAARPGDVRSEVRRHFERYLSFPALARKWKAAYASLHVGAAGR